MDIDNRVRSHLNLLNKNEHYNVYLQRAWNKYGSDSFVFVIVEYCSKEKLRELEQHYIDSLTPHYNVSKNAKAPMDGRKHSEETLKKLKGREPWNRGIPRTEEERALISESHKRSPVKQTEEYKDNVRKRFQKYREEHGTPFKGKTHTEETRKLFRNNNKSKKRIICIDTGEIFEAQIDITRKYGLRQGHISEHLNGKRASVKGFNFKYEE